MIVAHIGHWWESVLYALPMVLVAVALWRASRRDTAATEDEVWEGANDPQWAGGWADDPRLRDDD